MKVARGDRRIIGEIEEREFDELRACGDEYRRLERELQEQIRVWNVLKKTD